MCSNKKVLQNPKREKKEKFSFFPFLSEMGEEMSSATKRERKKLGVYPDEKEFQR